MKIAKGNTGVIFDIKKFAVHDGPGIRSTVFMKGCPLRCQWCHNPENLYLKGFHTSRIDQKSVLLNFCEFDRKIAGKEISADRLLEELVKDRLFYEESGGGVTFSGGEPLLQIDFLANMLKKCKSEYIHTVIDTSGYSDFEKFKMIYEFTDLFYYDLKIWDDEAHHDFTGVSNDVILKNLLLLSQLGEKLIIRIPLIPDISDTEKNITQIVEFLLTLETKPPVHLLPYNEIGEDKYRRFGLGNGKERKFTQSEKQLEKISHEFISGGFEVKLRG